MRFFDKLALWSARFVLPFNLQEYANQTSLAAFFVLGCQFTLIFLFNINLDKFPAIIATIYRTPQIGQFRSPSIIERIKIEQVESQKCEFCISDDAIGFDGGKTRFATASNIGRSGRFNYRLSDRVYEANASVIWALVSDEGGRWGRPILDSETSVRYIDDRGLSPRIFYVKMNGWTRSSGSTGDHEFLRNASEQDRPFDTGQGFGCDVVCANHSGPLIYRNANVNGGGGGNYSSQKEFSRHFFIDASAPTAESVKRASFWFCLLIVTWTGGLWTVFLRRSVTGSHFVVLLLCFLLGTVFLRQVMINLERAILGTEDVAVSSEIDASATTWPRRNRSLRDPPQRRDGNKIRLMAQIPRAIGGFRPGDLVALGFPKQLRQPCDVDGDPSRTT
jgi:hypothetical protein